MNDRWKIAIACFIGGALCGLVACMVAPMFWWLGILAGMASGYLSYEFREVLAAIPIAWRKARRGSLAAWQKFVVALKAWRTYPHPFVYAGIIFTAIATICIAIGILRWSSPPQYIPLGGIALQYMLLSLFGGILSGVVIGGLFLAFADIGAALLERCYWVPSKVNTGKYAQELRDKGYREVPLTYANAARWAIKAFLKTTWILGKFYLWTTWKGIAIGAWRSLCFLRRFGWYLFKLIHSHKRVLCAIDGTLGGVASYFLLASAHGSFAGNLVIILFGGILGAAFGVLNYEVVSKRILHLVPVRST